MDLTLIFTIIGIILSIVIPLAGYYYKKNKELKTYYSLIWKSSSKLTPKDLLGERPFDKTYFERYVDKFLTESLKNKRNALIVGPPLSGKTRAVYNLLRSYKANLAVLATRNIDMPAFEFPPDYKFHKEKIIFIDDFQNFIEKQDKYSFLFKAAKEKGIPVIATCHSGKEFVKAKNKLVEQNLDIDVIFGNNIYEINKVSVDEGKDFANRLGVKWDNIKFNGTIGSIFMRLSEMERRYEHCDTIEKTILRILRSLYICGVYEDNCNFKIKWIKKLAAKYELSGKDFEWTGWLKNLEGREFIQVVKRDKVWAEDAYLEYIVKPEAEITNREVFEDVIEVFEDDTEALRMTGERAYDNGNASIHISAYMKLTISAFEKILNHNDATADPRLFVKANYYCGMAYWSLSKVENTKENCLRSIGYYKSLIDNTEINLRPEEYAFIKNKTGNTYNTLAQIENRIDNCRTAIENFNEALNTYTIENFPEEYAQTNNNLGGAYLTLREGDKSTDNLLKAAHYFEESLRIRTPKSDPKGYAYSKNNLANTFTILSQYEDPEKNLLLALDSYNEALKTYDKEKFPLQYGMTLNNIGNAYCFLANVKNKKENALKAKEAYAKALEVRTKENTPIQYGNTIFNFADVYMILFDAEEDPDHLYKAIDYFNAAQDCEPENLYTFRRGEINSLLGKAFLHLAVIEKNQQFFIKGEDYFKNAVEIFEKLNVTEMGNKALTEYNVLKSKFNSTN